MGNNLGSRRALLATLCLLGSLTPAGAAAAGPVPVAGPALEPAVEAAPVSPSGILGVAADLLAGASASLGQLTELGQAVGSSIGGATIAGVNCGTSGSLDTGSDGRLTILLLGSDWRSWAFGERLDSIIVATRKPGGAIAMANIPRDMVYFPVAGSNGGGTTGTRRVNAQYQHYKLNGASRCRALLKFKRDVARALATEIDYYAMIRMQPFKRLVQEVRPVRVDVPGEIRDSGYIGGGAFFPDVDDYPLRGFHDCDDLDSCHAALAYVRSRKGTQGGKPNNDFRRALRQQQFVFETMRRVRARGTEELSDLVSSIQGNIYSNAPKDYTAALAVYGLLAGITMAGRDGVVFGPTVWAYANSTTPIYTFRPRVGKIRDWIDDHFGA